MELINQNLINPSPKFVKSTLVTSNLCERVFEASSDGLVIHFANQLVLVESRA